ncbi:MAG TPA: YfhO family protein, partial [Methylomirabilota bacterium]|nr:YfhO family protein [Methylomirabilota bacterium]
SLPKIETLRVIIPGIFGYRMEPRDGSNYWGAVGRPEGAKAGQHSGSGEYAGLLVVVAAVWALGRSRKQKDPIYDDLQRVYIWFWGAMALLALLFAWGYHAPFYKLVYSLPYFSTIRNPIKFMHLFHFCLLILFGFGLDNLIRRYCAVSPTGKTLSFGEQFSSWRKGLGGFEKKWVYGSVLVTGLAFLSMMAFSSSRRSILRYLQETGFTGELGEQIVRFAQGELLWFALYLAVTLLIIALILSRSFSGARANYAFVLLGVILFADLTRANKPWILYYDHTYKYQSNPLIDALIPHKNEQRVTGRFLPHGGWIVTDSYDFVMVYFEWLQNQFQALNIHSLDIIQMPRMPALDQQFLNAFSPANSPPTVDDLQRLPRLWQLTNTRLLLGQRTTESTLESVMVTNGSLTLTQAFNLVMKEKPDPSSRMQTDHVTVQFATNGQFGIFEYRDALPRAAIYSHWEKPASEQETLTRLASPAFNPHQAVLINSDVPQPSDAAPVRAEQARVVSYRPRHVEIEAEASKPSVLLLNDRYHPHWKVFVDGQEQPLLRCNYIMRGVHIPAGKHKVLFHFAPPVKALWVSLAGLAVTLGTIGFLLIQGRRATAPAPTP